MEMQTGVFNLFIDNDYNMSAIISGDASNNMHLQNLQGLAALANAANSPGEELCKNESRCKKTCLQSFRPRSDTIQAVQPQEMAGGL